MMLAADDVCADGVQVSGGDLVAMSLRLSGLRWRLPG